MSEVTGSVTNGVLTNTLALTDEYQELFSYEVINSTVQISMVEGGVNIGSIFLLVSGGVAKNVAYTGGIDFSGSTDLSLLPLSYNASSNSMNYTIWFEYTDNKIKVARNTQDPAITITFTGVFSSAIDSFGLTVYRVDRLQENIGNGGINFDSKVNLNGGIVNIGTSSSSNNAVNIGTNSSSGGRQVNIGNTITGSKTTINGVIETPNPTEDTVTFNDTSDIEWTDVNSTVKRIGKIVHVVVKANLLAQANLTKGTQYDMFSLTPTDKYTTNYVVTGSCFDEENNIGCILSTGSSADFKILLPNDIANTNSTTIYGSVSYISN